MLHKVTAKDTIYDVIREMKVDDIDEVEDQLEDFESELDGENENGQTPLLYAIAQPNPHPQCILVLLSKRFPNKHSTEKDLSSHLEFTSAITTAIEKRNIYFFQALAQKKFLNDTIILSASRGAVDQADPTFLKSLCDLAKKYREVVDIGDATLALLGNFAKEEQAPILLSRILKKYDSKGLSLKQAQDLLAVVLDDFPRRADSQVALPDMSLIADMYLHFPEARNTPLYKEDFIDFKKNVDEKFIAPLLTKELSKQEAQDALDFFVKHRQHYRVILAALIVRLDNITLATEQMNTFLPWLCDHLYKLANSALPSHQSNNTQRYLKVIGLVMINNKRKLFQLLQECDADILEKVATFFTDNQADYPNEARRFFQEQRKLIQLKNALQLAVEPVKTVVAPSSAKPLSLQENPVSAVAGTKPQNPAAMQPKKVVFFKAGPKKTQQPVAKEPTASTNASPPKTSSCG